MIALAERRVLPKTESADVIKFALLTMLTLPFFVVEIKANLFGRSATSGLAFSFSFANSFSLSFLLLALVPGHVFEAM